MLYSCEAQPSNENNRVRIFFKKRKKRKGKGQDLMTASGLGVKMKKIMRKEDRRREKEERTCILIDFKIVLIHFNALHGPAPEQFEFFINM